MKRTLLKALWWLVRVSCEFSILAYAVSIPAVWFFRILKIENEDFQVNAMAILTLALTVAVEFLWYRLKKKKTSVPDKPKAAKPASSSVAADRLTVAAAPRPTGNSTYIMLKPAAALKAKNYIMLDTETTGFNRSADRVIEIGMIKCIDDKPVETYTTFVNPDMHIPSNVSRLTGITDVDVKDAPQFAEIADEVMSFIDGLPVVAHNAHFDAGMLSSELNYLGLDYVVKVIDTLPLARSAFPELHNHKLKTLIDELGLADHEQQHRALDDADVTHRLYLKCKDALDAFSEEFQKSKKDKE